MALCRCKVDLARPIYYTHYVEPVGYPETSSICGRNNCTEPGLIWLKEKEVIQFNLGERVFSYDHNCSKVKVLNNITPR
jgi:hypothetical protein